MILLFGVAIAVEVSLLWCVRSKGLSCQERGLRLLVVNAKVSAINVFVLCMLCLKPGCMHWEMLNKTICER